jgi:hypothetical protein
VTGTGAPLSLETLARGDALPPFPLVIDQEDVRAYL